MGELDLSLFFPDAVGQEAQRKTGEFAADVYLGFTARMLNAGKTIEEANTGFYFWWLALAVSNHLNASNDDPKEGK